MAIKLVDIVTVMKSKWTYGDKFFGYTEEFNDNHNTQYPSILITPPTSVPRSDSCETSIIFEELMFFIKGEGVKLISYFFFIFLYYHPTSSVRLNCSTYILN